MTFEVYEREGTRIAPQKAGGDRYKVRLMGWEPGAKQVEGSSGTYPVNVIKRDFPEAFPAGTRMRANHDGFCEAGGDIRRVIAKTVDTPWAESDGMYATAQIAQEWSSYVEQFGDVIGLSISAAAELAPVPEDAEVDDYGRQLDENGNPMKPVVERFLTQEESPYNSVDFVEAPGADGRIVARAVEAAQKSLVELNVREQVHFTKNTHKIPVDKPAQESLTNPSGRNKEDDSMDDAERAALVAEAAQAAATAAVEALNRQPESAPEQPTLGQQTEAVLAAGLTEAGREAVYERISRGETLEAALAAERSREDAMRAELGAAGAAREDDSRTQFGYTVEASKQGLPAGDSPTRHSRENADQLSMIGVD